MANTNLAWRYHITTADRGIYCSEMSMRVSPIALLALVYLLPADGGRWMAAAQALSPQYVHDGWTTERGLPQNTVSALLQTRDGYLWVGAYGGLARFEGVKFTVFDTGNAPGLPSNRILALCEDRAGQLWVGAGSDARVGGLYRFQDGRFVRYGAAEGCALTDVRNITEDRSGALWVGGVTGMSRYQDGKFTNYTTAQGLSNNYVRDIYEDAEGVFWIGTYGGGLNRFKDGRFTHISTRQGLYDNIVSRILENDHGNLWISCNRGIYRASRRELNDVADGRLSAANCITYTVADGMKSNETNGGFRARAAERRTAGSGSRP